MKKAVILVNKISGSSSADEKDVLTQAVEVEKALISLDYKPFRIYADLDLKSIIKSIERIKPVLVVNLVETLGGKPELIHIVPALLESMHIPFTGSGSFSMLLTSDKIRSKKLFSVSDIPTPGWLVPGKKIIPDKSKHYILKPVWEDGSVGITDQSVLAGDDPLFIDWFSSGDTNSFAEEYIHGREFNLSIIGCQEGIQILPPAEIKFLDYPEGKPHILNYASKWDEFSFEYKNSVRSFDFGEKDSPLLEELKAISLRCWHVFELRGYARVDFRVDSENIPYVLEVNANPCISPDAGFIAAAQKAGLKYKDVVSRIISVSLKNTDF